MLQHSRSLLRDVSGVTVIGGDLREPEPILSDPELRVLVDLSRPVGLCMTLVLHFLPSDDDPYGVLAKFRDTLCPGSFLVLSHVTGDGREADLITEIDHIYDTANAPLIMRSRDQVARFFDGFNLVQPGLVFLSQWRPTGDHYAQGGPRWGYCGVAKKP